MVFLIIMLCSQTAAVAICPIDCIFLCVLLGGSGRSTDNNGMITIFIPVLCGLHNSTISHPAKRARYAKLICV